MNKGDKALFEIFLRYALLIISAVPRLFIFYFLFTPLTIYAVYFMLKLFFPVTLLGNNIYFLNGFSFSIIPACVAGAAYYLLFVLVMSVPKIKPIKRISILLISFASFFIANVLRIILLSVLYLYESPFSEILHEFLWHFGSVVLTTAIWFFEVYFFKIREVPLYSDLKFLYRKSLFYKK